MRVMVPRPRLIVSPSPSTSTILHPVLLKGCLTFLGRCQKTGPSRPINPIAAKKGSSEAAVPHKPFDLVRVYCPSTYASRRPSPAPLLPCPVSSSSPIISLEQGGGLAPFDIAISCIDCTRGRPVRQDGNWERDPSSAAPRTGRSPPYRRQLPIAQTTWRAEPPDLSRLHSAASAASSSQPPTCRGPRLRFDGARSRVWPHHHQTRSRV